MNHEEEIRNEYQRNMRDQSQIQKDEQDRQMQEQLFQYMEQTIQGGPSSLRVIAKIAG